MRRAAPFEAAYLSWVGEQLALKRRSDKEMLIGPFADTLEAEGRDGDVGRIMEFVLSGPDVLGRLDRHEKALSNEITKLMKELKAIQLERIEKRAKESGARNSVEARKGH